MEICHRLAQQDSREHFSENMPLWNGSASVCLLWIISVQVLLSKMLLMTSALQPFNQQFPNMTKMIHH